MTSICFRIGAEAGPGALMTWRLWCVCVYVRIWRVCTCGECVHMACACAFEDAWQVSVLALVSDGSECPTRESGSR